jgi:hypothetical protein
MDAVERESGKRSRKEREERTKEEGNWRKGRQGIDSDGGSPASSS